MKTAVPPRFRANTNREPSTIHSIAYNRVPPLTRLRILLRLVKDRARLTDLVRVVSGTSIILQFFSEVPCKDQLSFAETHIQLCFGAIPTQAIVEHYTKLYQRASVCWACRR